MCSCNAEGCRCKGFRRQQVTKVSQLHVANGRELSEIGICNIKVLYQALGQGWYTQPPASTGKLPAASTIVTCCVVLFKMALECTAPGCSLERNVVLCCQHLSLQHRQKECTFNIGLHATHTFGQFKPILGHCALCTQTLQHKQSSECS